MHTHIIYKVFFVILFFVLFSCQESEKPTSHTITEPVVESPAIPEITFTVVNTFPHDTGSFTEGFLFYNNQLFESTGSPDNLPQTQSLFGPVDFKTGKINKKAELDRTLYFGEGIVFLNNKIFQLTYKNQIGFIYDATSFKKLGQFNYSNKEGWGLTTDGKSLIMSDGTNFITYLDPTNFSVVKTLDVSENNYTIVNINELEYIKGYIYANIWTTNTVIKIDPANGNVVGKLNLNSLAFESENKYDHALETNGIAYDSISNKVYVTGKMWPTIYEIKFDL